MRKGVSEPGDSSPGRGGRDRRGAPSSGRRRDSRARGASPGPTRPTLVRLPGPTHSSPALCVAEPGQCAGRSEEGGKRGRRKPERGLLLGLSALPPTKGNVTEMPAGEVPLVAQWVTDPTSIQEDSGSIPGPDRWVKDPLLLWLWCRLAAVAPIRPLTWEPPYAMDAALKAKKERRKERKSSPMEQRDGDAASKTSAFENNLRGLPCVVSSTLPACVSPVNASVSTRVLPLFVFLCAVSLSSSQPLKHTHIHTHTHTPLSQIPRREGLGALLRPPSHGP